MTRAGALGGSFYRIYTGSSVSRRAARAARRGGWRHLAQSSCPLVRKYLDAYKPIRDPIDTCCFATAHLASWKRLISSAGSCLGMDDNLGFSLEKPRKDTVSLVFVTWQISAEGTGLGVLCDRYGPLCW
jgi:hypothetical protein